MDIAEAVEKEIELIDAYIYKKNILRFTFTEPLTVSRVGYSKKSSSDLIFNNKLADGLFELETMTITNNHGLPVTTKRHEIATVVLCKPKIYFEAILALSMEMHGYKHNIRSTLQSTQLELIPEEIYEPSFIQNIPLVDLIEWCFDSYQIAKGKTYKNHWSIYPSMLCDVTPNRIFKDMTKRISKDVRPKIILASMNLRMIPDGYMKWLTNELILLNLINEPTDTVKMIKQKQKNFLGQVKTYDTSSNV